MFSNHARSYFESNLSVIPVNQKTPEIKDWQKYCDNMPTEEQLSQWEVSFKDNNIGLCLGQASNIVAFDFDYEGPDAKIILSLIEGILPPSPVRKIGKKGFTSFYKFSGQKNMSINRGKKRVFDFLSTGRQTVLPPSLHPLGMTYKWITPVSLLDIDISELPSLDQDILEQLKTLLQTDTEELLEERIVISIPRHDLCVGYIFKCMVRLTTEKEIAEAVVKYDKQNFLNGIYEGKPAYFEDDKYFKNKKPDSAAIELVKRIVRWAKNKSARTGQTFKIGSRTEIITASTGFHFVSEKVDKKTGEVTITRRPDYYGFALWCKENVKAITLEDGSFCIYENGCYKKFPDLALESFLIEKSNQTVSPKEIGNFIKILKAKSYASVIQPKSGLINLKNGILDSATGLLTPHDPSFHFFYKLDIEYNKEAKSPLWDKFLSNIFDKNEDLITLINQIFGYCLQGGYPYLQKAFVFYGIGRNGKSTVLNVLQRLLGQDNISNVPVFMLDKPFTAIRLENKLVNINEELFEDEIQSSMFKDVVSGGKISAAHKFKDERAIDVYARFIFATNKFPTFKDTSLGLDRRLVIIPFNHIVAEKDIDTNILGKLSLELSGILNRAIEGINSIKINGKITEPQETKDLKAEYREESDQVYNWINDNCSPKLGNELNVDDLYFSFINWCEREGRSKINKVHFSRRVILACSNHKDYGIGFVIRTRSKQTRLICGLELKPIIG